MAEINKKNDKMKSKSISRDYQEFAGEFLGISYWIVIITGLEKEVSFNNCVK